MSENPSEQEPSIEEILASIRQIISDDDEEEPTKKPKEMVVEDPVQHETDNVLELTEEDLAEIADDYDDEPELPEDSPIEIDMINRDDDMDLSDYEDNEPAPEPVPEPAYEPEEVDLSDYDDEEDEDEDDFEEDEDDEPEYDESPNDVLEELRRIREETQMKDTSQKHVPSDILSSGTQAAAIGSIAKLASKMPINSPRSYDGVTLEDIVREMLHPMLREWMDDNLPPMVERIVQKELEKLARRAMDD